MERYLRVSMVLRGRCDKLNLGPGPSYLIFFGTGSSETEGVVSSAAKDRPQILPDKLHQPACRNFSLSALSMTNRLVRPDLWGDELEAQKGGIP